MSNPNKLIKVTAVNGYDQLYVGGMVVLTKVNSVAIDNAIYIVRDDCVALSTGKKTIMQIVQSGKQVYLVS